MIEIILSASRNRTVRVAIAFVSSFAFAFVFASADMILHFAYCAHFVTFSGLSLGSYTHMEIGQGQSPASAPHPIDE